MGNIKQEDQIMCPICKEILPNHARGKTFHAEKHGLTSEELALQILGGFRPLCECGCSKTTRWTGWSAGFSRYSRGHMKSEIRSAGVEKLKKTLAEEHWARGLTKETSDVIMRASKLTSSSVKRGFAEGKIKHWMAGKTASTDPRIAAAIFKRSENLANGEHWNRMSEAELEERLSSSLGDKFNILSDLRSFETRKNNRIHECVVECKHCKSVETTTIYNIIRHESKRCHSCNQSGGSVPQKELENFVDSLGVNCIKKSDRTNPTGFELDVYIPSRSFAIEFNGLYWHSSAVVDKQYHVRKTAACDDNGISLMHIFQDEWEDSVKRKIIQSMIKNRLGMSKKTGARSCKIIKLDARDAKEFFDKNHIDGDTKGFVTYALANNVNEILAAIKLRKSYSSKWKGWIEIARYACLVDNNVIGGHSKLLRHVEAMHAERIFTYVDTRFGGTGSYCEKSGMQLNHVTGCSFWWTDRVNRYNRLHCTASDGKTEKVNAEEQKLLKIWGCKNLVYVSRNQ